MAQQHYSNDVSVSVSQKVDALDYAKLEVRRDGQLLQLVLGAVADWWYWRRSPCRVSCVGGRISVKVRLQISLVIKAFHTGHLRNHVPVLVFNRPRPLQFLIERFAWDWW